MVWCAATGLGKDRPVTDSVGSTPAGGVTVNSVGGADVPPPGAGSVTVT